MMAGGCLAAGAVTRLLDEACRAFADHRPGAAWLAGATVPDLLPDDLVERGTAWRARLAELRDRAGRLADAQPGPITRQVLGALDDWLALQLRVEQRHSPLRLRLLDVVAALTHAAATDRPVEDAVSSAAAVIGRVSDAIEAGQLGHGAGDVELAARLQQLAGLDTRYAPLEAPLRECVGKLTERVPPPDTPAAGEARRGAERTWPHDTSISVAHLRDAAERAVAEYADAWRAAGASPQEGVAESGDWLAACLATIEQVAADVVDVPARVPVVLLPPVATVLAGHALYRPSDRDGNAALLLNPRIAAAPSSARQRAIRLVILAHEIAPGHHCHWESARGGPLGRWLPVLTHPAGFEGWAVMAEESVAVLGPDERAAVALFRVKRLLPAAVVALRGAEGKATAGGWLKQLYADYPQLASIGDGEQIMRTNMAHAYGWLETVEKLVGDRKSIDSATRGAYLRVGPIRPWRARLLAHLLAAENGGGQDRQNRTVSNEVGNA